MSETPWKLCEVCGVEPVDHGRVCETCKSLPSKITLEETKECNKCHEHKPLDQFHKDSASADGKTKVCKDCKRVIDREAGKRKRAKTATGITCMHQPEQPGHYATVPVKGNYLPGSLDNLDAKYQVTVDFSDCKWLLAYLEGESNLPVSLQIKRRLIDSMTDGELRSWLFTDIVS